MLADMVREPLDILVVGGGITGVGIAHDAAQRGFRVGLVEQHDYACGTSSRSSKMIHGGLRYLATGDIGLVRESLRERKSLQDRAPHLVHPLPMLLPIHRVRDRIKYGSGLWAYDVLGAWRAGMRHRWVGRRGVSAIMSNIEPEGLRGGLLYQDAAADDARLVITVLRSAVACGARVVNGARVSELLELGGRVVGARVASDVADGGSVEIRARVVVNASGVWADQLYAGITTDPGFSLLPSKGIHLTVRREHVGITAGVAFFPQTGRNIFIEPWDDDLAIVGTSDAPFDGNIEDPSSETDEIQRLLDDVNPFMRVPLAASDVISAWAGVRPLVIDAGTTAPATGSKDVSRNHRTVVTPGLVTMVGGKLTTYRQMAQDAVDAAVREGCGSGSPCRTMTTPLDGFPAGGVEACVAGLARSMDIDEQGARHLVRRYGSNVTVLDAMCRERPELLAQLHPHRPYLEVEAAYAIQHEMARNVEDVVHRRTRLAIETIDGGAAAVPAIERLLGDYT